MTERPNHTKLARRMENLKNLNAQTKVMGQINFLNTRFVEEKCELTQEAIEKFKIKYNGTFELLGAAVEIHSKMPVFRWKNH